MKPLKYNIKRSMANMTLVFKITGCKRMKIRIYIGKLFLIMATKIMGCGLKIIK